VSTLEEQLAYAAAHLQSARVSVQADGVRALRWSAQLPPGWSTEDAELLVLVPPAYPAQAPSGFDLRGAASVGGNVPGGAGARDVDGVAHQHYCWNPQSTIDYTALDGVWRFAQFSERRFAQVS
jgi:hypothetical protein